MQVGNELHDFQVEFKSHRCRLGLAATLDVVTEVLDLGIRRHSLAERSFGDYESVNQMLAIKVGLFFTIVMP